MLKVNTIHQGDCVERMKQLDNNSVDLVVTDPPFNYNKNYGKTSNDNLKEVEYLEWCKKWIVECYRILKNEGSIYIKIAHKYSYKISNILEQVGFIYQNQIIWKNVSCFPAKTRFATLYEVILFFTKSKDYYFDTYAETIPNKFRSWTPTRDAKLKGQMGDIWLDIKAIYTGTVKHPEVILKRDGSNKKAHPCQMPKGLSSRAIKFSTKEGDLVLDPFGGTGTTAVTCKELNRNFISFEINPEYIKIANRRLEQGSIRDWLKC